MEMAMAWAKALMQVHSHSESIACSMPILAKHAHQIVGCRAVKDLGELSRSDASTIPAKAKASAGVADSSF